jgi:hypothetical protein
VALQAENLVDREERRTTLTNAWFEDVRALESMILISIDTYEQASTEFARWINGPFLYRVAQSASLRVLIAGQQVPDLCEHLAEWGRCCQIYELQGVKEAVHWMPVVEARGRYVPDADPLSYMAGICDALGGCPGDILNIISRFPLREDRP